MRIFCGICAASMLVVTFCGAFEWAEKIVEFLNRHRIIRGIYVICGAIGLFNAIISR